MKRHEACSQLKRAIKQLERLPHDASIDLTLRYHQSRRCPSCGEPSPLTTVYHNNSTILFCSKCSHQFKER